MRTLAKALRGLGAGMVQVAPLQFQNLRDEAMADRASAMAALDQQFRTSERMSTQDFTSAQQNQRYEQEGALYDKRTAAEIAAADLRYQRDVNENALSRNASAGQAAAARADARDARQENRVFDLQDARIKSELAGVGALPPALKETLSAYEAIIKNSEEGSEQQNLAITGVNDLLSKVSQLGAKRQELSTQAPLVERNAANPVPGLISGAMGGGVSATRQVISGPPAPAGVTKQDSSGRTATSLGGGQWELR